MVESPNGTPNVAPSTEPNKADRIRQENEPGTVKQRHSNFSETELNKKHQFLLLNVGKSPYIHQYK